MPEVTMYATKTCPFCTMAQRLLAAKDVEFELIDVGADPDLWQEMEAKSQRNTVPQIFIGSHHVGGFDDLSAANKSGELDTLLNG